MTIIRRLLPVAVLALLVAAPAASAQLVPQRGTVTVGLGGPGEKALSKAKVRFGPGAPAKRLNGAAVFPVTGGVADPAKARGVARLSGELRARKGSRLRVLRQLVLVRDGGATALYAQVKGKPGGCAPVTRVLDKLGRGRKLVKAARAGVTKLCRRARLIRVAGVAHRTAALENGVADGAGQLRLRADAAALLNAVAGHRVVHAGMGFGALRATTCAGSPCPPPAILGSFTPFVTGSVGIQQVIAEAQAIGASTVRFSANAGEARPAIGQFASAGLRVLLTVRSSGSPAKPPTTPAELATYKQSFAKTIASLPADGVVQVENEEIAPKFFAGTMAQYGTELSAAVDVAHARKLRITNGGLTYKPLVLMAWLDLYQRGELGDAQDLAKRVFSDTPADRRVLKQLSSLHFRKLKNKNLQAAWNKAKQLIPIYKASKMDWVNFHWYGDDDKALATCVRYLERATGKPAVTTEIGQYDTNPKVVSGHLKTLLDTLRLPLVIWYDADGSGPARALHDAPGVLRANGRAFKAFVAAHRATLR